MNKYLYVLYYCNLYTLLFFQDFVSTFGLGNLEKEFDRLYASEKDKDGLESIQALHKQLDNDNDGTIEPFETGEFIRDDLQSSDSNKRQQVFHIKDAEITVTDLWKTWKLSEVHNWTTDQTVDWLISSVGLPGYENNFRAHSLNGSYLPILAVNLTWLSKTLGVRNPIHRSKIALKAMDVVLFGPPKDTSNLTKDIIFTIIILFSISGLFYTYQQNKKAQGHLKKMMEDFDTLGIAEQNLLDLQNKLNRKKEVIGSEEGNRPGEENDSKNSSLGSESMGASSSGGELKRMKQEIEVLRNQLYVAESELEDKYWVCSPILQTWLQISYETETINFAIKRRLAEEQLEEAKDMCDKLKKKRSSLVGAFVSSHGHSIDEIDKMILSARAALLEVTHDLSERTHRWKQIELLTGVPIVSNPGLTTLHKIVRNPSSGSRRGAWSRMEDFDDTESLAPPPSLTSGLSTSSRASLLLSRKLERPSLSRESSKESSGSSSSCDELEALSGKGGLRNCKPSSFDSGMGSSFSVLAEIPNSVSVSSHPTRRIVLSESTPAYLNRCIDDSISDSGSLNDSEKKDKKKRLFFAFRKKKLKDI